MKFFRKKIYLLNDHAHQSFGVYNSEDDYIGMIGTSQITRLFGKEASRAIRNHSEDNSGMVVLETQIIVENKAGSEISIGSNP